LADQEQYPDRFSNDFSYPKLSKIQNREIQNGMLGDGLPPYGGSSAGFTYAGSGCGNGLP
jgi:hypothetical protein